MFPRLFTVGDYFTLHTYGLMMVLALLSGLYVSARLAPRAGLSREMVWNLGIYMAVAGVLGGKLFLIASEWRYYAEYPRQILSLTTFQAAGFFYGGLLQRWLLLGEARGCRLGRHLHRPLQRAHRGRPSWHSAPSYAAL